MRDNHTRIQQRHGKNCACRGKWLNFCSNWLNVYGKWLNVCGNWLNVCGNWLNVCSKWLNVYGKRLNVYGKWLNVCSKWDERYGDRANCYHKWHDFCRYWFDTLVSRIDGDCRHIVIVLSNSAFLDAALIELKASDQETNPAQDILETEFSFKRL